MLLRESKQFLFGCLAHILSVVGHSITVENYACFYRFTLVWCRYCVFCVFFMIKQVLVIFSLFICFAPHHEANPSPINRVFISFQQSMTWKKRHCNRAGNHEKMSSHLQTGTVRSQGEPSLSLFLVTVHHFVYKIAHTGLWLLFPPFCSNLMSVFFYPDVQFCFNLRPRHV